MAANQEILARKNLYHSRGGMYGLLSRLYRIEADQELIDQIRKMDLTAYLEVEEMKQGYHLLKKYTEREVDLEELAVDYAKTFLGFGPKRGEGAFPYESVYTSVRGLLMQEARDEVVALYNQENLVRDPRLAEPEDHIAFEFMYMSYLNQKTAEALEAGQMEEIETSEQKQKNFVQNHLINWIPRFCKETERISDTGFYQGAAKLTAGFLKLESQLLNIEQAEKPIRIVKD